MRLSTVMKLHAMAAMINLFAGLSVVAALGPTGTQAESSSDTETAPTPLKTFQIYHSLKGNEFKPRGTIQLASSSEDGTVLAIFHETADALDKSVLEEMDAIVSSGGFYRVKVVDEDNGTSSMASVPSCEVRRANFREEISLTLGNIGSIISISYKALASPLAPKCHELESFTEASKDREFAFKTTVTYSTAKPGLTIPSVLPTTNPAPGFDWIKRLNKSAENNNAGRAAEGEGGIDPEKPSIPEHQSFIRKYWYIVLPVTIMTLLGPEEPPAGSGGAGQGAAAAGGAAAAAGQRKRRGKRG